MSQSYKKSCMYCNKEIQLSDKASGKWLPYNLDGSTHECKNQAQGTKKVETKDNDKEWVPTPEAKAWVREIMEGPKIKELDERLRRVEKILFQEGR